MSVTYSDIANIKIKPLGIPMEHKRFFSILPANCQFTINITGASFSGKSVYALNLAKILSRFGNVFYANFEENISKGTLQAKIKIAKIHKSNRNIKFFEAHEDTLDYLYNKLKYGNYKYCIVDSVNEIATRPKEILHLYSWIKKFPNVNFIFVLHSDKQELRYLGPASLKNKVDIQLFINKDRIVDCLAKNRFKSPPYDNEYWFFDSTKNKALMHTRETNHVPIKRKKNKRSYS